MITRPPEARWWDLPVVLNWTTGVLLTTVDDLYDFSNFILATEGMTTMGLAAMADTVRDALYHQHPALRRLDEEMGRPPARDEHEPMDAFRERLQDWVVTAQARWRGIVGHERVLVKNVAAMGATEEEMRAAVDRDYDQFFSGVERRCAEMGRGPLRIIPVTPPGADDE